MTTIYVTKSGSVEYCAKDNKQKCFDKGATCSSRNGTMACNTGWWTGGWWGGWWGWGGYWGVYGDNLTYLYTELDAPDEYRCGYNRPCFSRVHCDDELSEGVCAYPRIVNCKQFRCIGDYNNYYYDHCATKNGKDREQRCCAPPSNFTCEEGECDYEYEIVKKEYSVEYELVRPGYVCTERPKYPDSSCGSIPKYNDTCFKYQSSCSPEQKCLAPGQVASCKEDTPPEDYELIDTEVGGGFYYSWWWGGAGISWDYELDDCSCKCNRCTTCDQYDCDFAGYGGNYGYYGWGWSGYFGGIGTDCCGNPGYYWYGWYGWDNGICPEQKGDGSTKPWYCSAGGDCSQEDDSLEDFDSSVFVSGPYQSYSSCQQACSEDNKCIPPDRNYSRGLCCDKNFKKQMDDIDKTESECRTIGPSYEEKVTENLCAAGGCSTGAVNKYTKEMCTIDNSKFCTTSKIERKRSRKTYSYHPPIPDKAFATICSSCDPASNDECLKDPNTSCPSGTELTVIKVVNTFNPEEIVSSATAKLVVVFCKITTKKCEPPSKDGEDGEGGGGTEES